MRKSVHGAAITYSVAVILVALAMLFKLTTDYLFGGGPPLILFLTAVMFAARFCGFGPGILATVLSALVCVYFYFDPPGSLRINSTNDAFRLGVFLFEGVTLCILMNSLHAARRRVEQRMHDAVLRERALREGENANRRRTQGMASYLEKPIKSDELRRAIVAILANQSSHGRIALTPCQPTAGTASDIPEPRRSLSVLVVEDNPVSQEVAVRFLIKQGHRATVAENGKRALDALAQNYFDLILMDLQMPEMNGFEATQAIRDAEATTGRHIPIVAMTAHAMKDDRERCLAAGMDDYLAKPVRAEELLRVMQSCQEAMPAAPRSMPATAVDPQICPLDRDAVLKNLDRDEDFPASVIELFLENAPTRMDEIRIAFNRGDMPSLGRAVHSLRGAAESLAGEPCSAAALRLENSADRFDSAGVAESLAELELEVSRLTAALSPTGHSETAADVAV